MAKEQREKRKKEVKRERWRGRGGIRKEAGDDVTMQLTPTAPGLHCVCANKCSGWGLSPTHTHTHMLHALN